MELWKEAVFNAGDEGAGRALAGLERVAIARDEGVDAIAQGARDFQQKPGENLVAGKLSGDFEDCCGTDECSLRCE